MIVDNTFTNIPADKKLVNKVLSGDTNAFRLIVKNTEKVVARIVFNMIKNAEDRKDIAQDIYLKAYKNLHAFRFQCRVSTWIAQIGYNTCLDYLRKKKSMPVFDDILNCDTGDIECESTSANFVAAFGSLPDELMAQKKLATLLKTEIEKLAPVHKTLISLYHNEELTYDEIGQVTGLPVGTIKNYLFRARRALKNNLLSNYKMEDL